MLKCFTIIFSCGKDNFRHTITTAAGLIVGIHPLFFHRFLQRRVDELVVGMEQEAIKLVEVVQGDRDGSWYDPGQ